MATSKIGTSSDTLQDWNKTFNSFAGTDILAIFAGHQVGELQGISWTTTREKAPLYVMGRVDPIAYSRGKRGIAGSMIFLTFDRAALLTTLREQSLFFARAREVKPEYRVVKELERKQGTDPVQTGAALANAFYPDQIPPFNVVLVAENEYGGGSKMVIKNCEILNNGSGVSVDDITTDESMTYVCSSITPWAPINFLKPIDAATPKLDLAPGEPV